MAYRKGNREQVTFLPSSIEEYVGADNPVRAYDVFVESLDFKKLGISINPYKVGNSSYDPRIMLKLLVYAYSYGVFSSRKIEREIYHNLSFIWLVGGVKPDHKTIAEFRRNNKKAISQVLKHCARLCIKLDLIAGNTLFLDGSKFRANAGIKNSLTKERCEKVLNKVGSRIETILSECEKTDRNEQEQGSFVSMQKELQDKKKLKSQVENILKELQVSGRKSINRTDPECVKIKGRQGSHAGYNVQSVVDEKHGLIVHTDVVNENNDRNQFADQINQANETLENKCSIACADTGYDNTDELKKIDDQEIKVIVPLQQKANKDKLQSFNKENFTYDQQKDSYVCPEGHILTYRFIDAVKKSKIYKITASSLCRSCNHFNVCTKSKHGKKIRRLLNEETREKIRSQYEQPESQTVYKLRQEKVELPFGHIKRNLKGGAFLMRGRDGANAEISLLASCFNMARMITLLGVPRLIEKLAS
jgi:transposase|tara:strand:+ start:143 stop:1570 length:1428 start_codon:yes stop_codon:yes gene_type:complete